MRWLIVFAAVSAVFLFGFSTGFYRLFPYQLIAGAYFASAGDFDYAWRTVVGTTNRELVPSAKGCHPDFIEGEVKSSKDGTLQKVCFRRSTRPDAPLLVHLHTWSTNFQDQGQAFLKELALRKDYNYIIPDARGPNRNPEACGSDLVISDIDDAISFMTGDSGRRITSVLIFGVSGGGYSGLHHYLRGRQTANNYLLWVPITDLESWYHETRNRGEDHAEDILRCTKNLDPEQLRLRSPLHRIPTKSDDLPKLQIFAGVRDGYEGPVPVTQSIGFYNRLVQSMGDNDAVVPLEVTLSLVRRGYDATKFRTDEDLRVIAEYRSGPVVLSVFDGKHEAMPKSSIKAIIESFAQR